MYPKVLKNNFSTKIACGIVLSSLTMVNAVV